MNFVFLRSDDYISLGIYVVGILGKCRKHFKMGRKEFSGLFRDATKRPNLLSELNGETNGVDATVMLLFVFVSVDFAHDFHITPSRVVCKLIV